MTGSRPQLRVVAPAASPTEAAAIVAALQRFVRETAPHPLPPSQAPDPWTRVAMLEGVSRGAQEEGASMLAPWINT
jgi:hypothetical protein